MPAATFRSIRRPFSVEKRCGLGLLLVALSVTASRASTGQPSHGYRDLVVERLARRISLSQ